AAVTSVWGLFLLRLGGVRFGLALPRLFLAPPQIRAQLRRQPILAAVRVSRRRLEGPLAVAGRFVLAGHGSVLRPRRCLRKSPAYGRFTALGVPDPGKAA